jgi:hypothetical protein
MMLIDLSLCAALATNELPDIPPPACITIHGKIEEPKKRKHPFRHKMKVAGVYLGVACGTISLLLDVVALRRK